MSMFSNPALHRLWLRLCLCFSIHPPLVASYLPGSQQTLLPYAIRVQKQILHGRHANELTSNYNLPWNPSLLLMSSRSSSQTACSLTIICHGHSTLDMLLLLSQQWLQVLDLKQEVKTISLDISQAFYTIWHPALLPKLTAYRIQYCLHSWISDFLRSSNKRVAPLLFSPSGGWSSPRLCPGWVWFLICINDLFNALEIPFFLPYRRLCHTVPVSMTGRQQPCHGVDLELIICWSDEFNMPFNHCKLNNLTMSLHVDREMNQ